MTIRIPLRVVSMCMQNDYTLVAMDSSGQLWSFNATAGLWDRWGFPIPFLKPVEAK
jgi:hypothetical protein